MRYRTDLIESLVKEIELQKNFLEDEHVNTIYFGGGTPSLLSSEEVSKVLEKIRRQFKIESNAEITLEANPDDINKEKLAAWKNLGINRLSIGIQSFFEQDLVWMNRAHNANQSYACIENSLEAGFQNISIDLIYGSPMLNDFKWEKNVQTAIDYNLPHLSCYALTVEEKTPLYKNIMYNKTENVDQDKQARQFLLLMEWLRNNGYEHYEVSNFARPGFRSRHNSSYWQGKKYLGLGPAAHSYDGSTRKWNVANNLKYIEATNRGAIEQESEMLTETQKLNEYIMISLRTMEGLNLEKIKTSWGENQVRRIEKRASGFISNKLIIQDENVIRLSDDGMLRADGIAADLFA